MAKNKNRNQNNKKPGHPASSPVSKRDIKNAVIRDVLIGLSDQNVFTSWIVVGLGGQSQGFGGYDLRANNTSHAFISGILKVVGVKDIKQLIGKAIRIDHDSTKIYRIGHYMEETWFDYETIHAALVPVVKAEETTKEVSKDEPTPSIPKIVSKNTEAKKVLKNVSSNASAAKR